MECIDGGDRPTCSTRTDWIAVGMKVPGIAGGSVTRMKLPGRRINNLWHSQMSTPQTSDTLFRLLISVIERCMLDGDRAPGDLVLDPTCGGATTAVAAEKWGTALDYLRHVAGRGVHSTTTTLHQRPFPTGLWPTQPTAHAKKRNSPTSRKLCRPRTDGATTPLKGSYTNVSAKSRQACLAYDLKTLTPFCWWTSRARSVP